MISLIDIPSPFTVACFIIVCIIVGGAIAYFNATKD